MKNKVILFFCIIIVLTTTLNTNAYAITNKDIVLENISNDIYELSYQIIDGTKSENLDDVIFYSGRVIDSYTISGIMAYRDGDVTSGLYSWANPNYTISEGEQIIQLKFDSAFDGEIIADIKINGIKTVVKEEPNDWVNPEDALIGKETQSIQSFSTTLTANTILLNTDTTYDINLNDKVKGSTYEWSSSNEKVVSVNKKNGKVTGLKEGKAKITCKVTTPDKETYELTSDVIVGIDDNFPLLTETELDLEVGDLFNINIENGIRGSKYKWTSSNRKIVTVNSSNGKVTAIGEGEVTVYCTITTPDKEIIVLSCNIYVTE